MTNVTDEAAIYRITNIIGQCVWLGSNIQNKDFSQLVDGIYFITINTND